MLHLWEDDYIIFSYHIHSFSQYSVVVTSTPLIILINCCFTVSAYHIDQLWWQFYQLCISEGSPSSYHKAYILKGSPQLLLSSLLIIIFIVVVIFIIFIVIIFSLLLLVVVSMVTTRCMHTPPPPLPPTSRTGPVLGSGLQDLGTLLVRCLHDLEVLGLPLTRSWNPITFSIFCPI